MDDASHIHDFSSDVVSLSLNFLREAVIVAIAIEDGVHLHVSPGRLQFARCACGGICKLRYVQFHTIRLLQT
jgi:hypothetical protein